MSYKPKILIVDDNPSLCKSLKVFLSVLEAEIMTVLSGKEAKASLTEHDFDLVLLDLILPDRSFSQILDCINSRNVDTLVILMSGQPSREIGTHALQKGVYGFLQKPFELEELLTTVQGALHRSMQNRERSDRQQGDFRKQPSGRDRRRLWKDRRLVKDPWYRGFERRSGKDRRGGGDRIRPWDTGPIQEKRQHRRVSVKWPLTIKGPWGSMRGEMKNVSAGGAFLCASQYLRLHEILSLKLEDISLSTDALSVTAKVVRSNIFCRDQVAHSYGIAVEFMEISEDDRKILTALTPHHSTESEADTSERPFEQSGRGGSTMADERRSLDLMVNPDLYPAVRILWKEAATAGEVFEATAPLHKEVWLHVAKDCRERAAQMDVVASQKLVSALNLVADLILGEVNAEEKRERNREAYESFAEFVAEINGRTDLDKIRKAQMIHDKACELKLN